MTVVAEAASLTVEDLVAGDGGVTVLEAVSLAARPGTITAVLGANGAGKTTLLRTISGLVRPRQGRILIDGADLARRRPEAITRAGLAHVPEGQGVITELTVEDNLGWAGWSGPGRPGPRHWPTPTSGSRCWPSGSGGCPARCPAASGRSWSSPGR